MKRILAIIVLAATLVSCSSIPAGMNKETYDVGVEALSWCERYDNGKITDDDLVKKMDDLYDKLESPQDTKYTTSYLEVGGCLVTIGSIRYGDKTKFFDGYEKLKKALGK